MLCYCSLTMTNNHFYGKPLLHLMAYVPLNPQSLTHAIICVPPHYSQVQHLPAKVIDLLVSRSGFPRKVHFL